MFAQLGFKQGREKIMSIVRPYSLWLLALTRTCGWGSGSNFFERVKAILLVAALTAVTGCGGGGSGSSAGSPNMSAEVNASSLAAIVSPEVTAAQIVTLSDGQRVVNSQLIIFGATTLSRDDLALLIAPYKGVIIGQNPEAFLYQVQFPADTAESALLEIKNILENNVNIIVVGLNSISSTTSSAPIYPSDPVWTDRPAGSNSDDTAWNMKVINAPEAWGLAYDGRKIDTVKVGVVDGGFSHRTDRDVHFESIIGPANDSLDILSSDVQEGMDRNNHGMHVSGIIGATGNNNLGVSGVAWKNIELLAARTDYSKFSLYAQITRLLKKGARVINFSTGDRVTAENPEVVLSIETLDSRLDSNRVEFSKFMDVMLKRYDFLFVGAAGNSGKFSIANSQYIGWGAAAMSDYIVPGSSNDSLAKLKAVIDLTNVRSHILIVGSLAPVYDASGNSIILEIPEYSQPGVSVEIAAPGGNYCHSNFSSSRWDRQYSEGGGANPSSCNTRAIWSTFYERELNIEVGTSQAAPHVTGAAALIWQVNPNLNAKQVKEILLSTAGGPNGHTVKKANGSSQLLPVLNLKMAIEVAISKIKDATEITPANGNVVPLVGQLICGVDPILNEANVIVQLYKVSEISGQPSVPTLSATTISSAEGVFTLNASLGRYFLRFTSDPEGVTQTKIFTAPSMAGVIPPYNISQTCSSFVTTEIESGIQSLDTGSNLLLGQINSAGSSGTQEAYPLRVNIFVDAQGLISHADYDFHRIAGTSDPCVFALGVNEATCFGRAGNYPTTSQIEPNGVRSIGATGSSVPVSLTMTDNWGVVWTGTITGLEWVGTWDATGPGANPQIGPDAGKTGTFRVQVAVTVN